MPKFIDLTNKVFGCWTVLNKSDIKKLNSIRWNCLCKCGTFRDVSGCDLRNGVSRSCGCSKRKIIKNNLVARKFNKLFVLERTEKRNPSGKTLYKCICDCEQITFVCGGDLTTSSVKSCGCLNKINGLNKLKLSVDNKVGRWTLKKYQNNRKWVCECDCGTIREVVASTLNRDKTFSCGCRGRGSQTHGLIYGLYDKDENLMYVGQTTQYYLSNRLREHISKPTNYKMDFWINSINYRPTIKPLIENVEIKNLDMMEKQLIKLITKEYHPLLNVTYHQ